MSAANPKSIPIQQGALNTPVENLNNGVITILNDFLIKLRNIDTATGELKMELFSDVVSFLGSLANVSPTSKLHVEKFLTEHKNMPQEKHHAELQRVVQQIVADQDAIALDLENCVQMANEDARCAQLAMSQQLRATLSEKAYLASEAHKAHAGSAPYDTRYLGYLLEPLLRGKYLVPIDEENYVRGFEFNAPTSNPYEDHLRDKFGDQKIFTPALRK